MKTFNGHRSWNAWNVSLWINNDERLYRGAMSFVKAAKNKDKAAQAFLYELLSNGERTTPDGGRYNLTTIRLAMRGM